MRRALGQVQAAVSAELSAEWAAKWDVADGLRSGQPVRELKRKLHAAVLSAAYTYLHVALQQPVSGFPAVRRCGVCPITLGVE